MRTLTSRASTADEVNLNFFLYASKGIGATGFTNLSEVTCIRKTEQQTNKRKEEKDKEKKKQILKIK